MAEQHQEKKGRWIKIRRQKGEEAEFLTAGEACKAVFCATASGFTAAKGVLISASPVPHCENGNEHTRKER